MPQLRFPSAIAGLDPIHQGKTRDLFRAQAKRGPYVRKKLLHIAATDRLSTHNIVHKSTIPKKAEVLTALTVYWLTRLFPSAGIRHHLIAHGKAVYDYLDGIPVDYPHNQHFRSIIVENVSVVPIEFIFRDRLGGSLNRDFYSKGIPDPYGLNLPPGLPLMHRFPEPEFTPTRKSEADEPMLASEVLRQYPAECALSRKSFITTRDYLRGKGIDLIDGKFEVGHDEEGNPVMVDEITTPDSSRFCRSDAIVLGTDPPWLDKELARIEAMRLWGSGPKVPLVFSPAVVSRLTDTYLEIFAGITGVELAQFQQECMS